MRIGNKEIKASTGQIIFAASKGGNEHYQILWFPAPRFHKERLPCFYVNTRSISDVSIKSAIDFLLNYIHADKLAHSHATPAFRKYLRAMKINIEDAVQA